MIKFDLRKSSIALASLVLATAVLSGCKQPVRQPAPTPASPAATTAPIAGSCTIGHSGGQDLPDPKCTPGVTNPQVTQDTIKTTICTKGWTATIRPPLSVTAPLKRKIAAAYHLAPGTQGELDHLISLELGGAPLDPGNLWIEPGKIPNPKDAVENTLNRAVCQGRISLKDAQTRIATNWPTATGGL